MRTPLTSWRFGSFCIKQPQQAARDLAPDEALRVLNQQKRKLFHGLN
jgi:hypothetical protein